MPTDFHQKPHGAFLSALDWLDRPGEVVRNLLHGSGEGAGRQLVDFLSAPVRALIPGDQSNWELSRPEDYVHGSDLAGIDKTEHPWLGMGADIVGDFATDPLAWLSFGSLGAAREGATVAAKAAAEGADIASTAAKTAEAGKNGGVALKVPFTKIGTPYAFQGQRVDPLSLVGKGLNAAKETLPAGAQAPIDNGILKLKSFFGWLKANPEHDAALAAAAAQRSGVSGAMKDFTDNTLLKNIPDKLASRFMELVDPADVNAVKPESRFSPTADQISNWKSRIDAAPDLADAEKETLKGMADKYGPFIHGVWQAGHEDYPAFNQAVKPMEEAPVASAAGGSQYGAGGGVQMSLMITKRMENELRGLGYGDEAINKMLPEEANQILSNGTMAKKPIFPSPEPSYDINTSSPTDFVPRELNGLSADQKEYFGNANPIHARTLTDAASYGKFMAENPGVTRNMDLRDVLHTYADKTGVMAEKASLGKAIAGDAFKSLTDPDSIKAVQDRIKALADSGDKESAMLLAAKFDGIPAPGGLEKAIGAVNRLFKQSAVAGAGLMKVSSITRNAIGHPGQLAMTEGMGGQALKQLLATPQTWWQGFKSGLEKYTGKTIPGDAISADIQTMRDAAQHSGGRFSNSLKWLEDQGRPDLAEGLRHGVIDAGFANQGGPDILKWVVMNGLKKAGVGPEGLDRAHQILEAPAAGFTGSENYARTKTFLDQMKEGLPADEAAAKQRESFYNYGTQTKENRLFRTVVPFGAFTAGAVKQGATGISRNPAWNDVLNPLFGQNDTGPVPPFVADQMRMPLGKGPDGQDHYLSGFAQPIETLNEVPNLTGAPLHEIARELQRTAVASSAPVLKTAYGLVTGKDPYFDTPYASYDRIPLVGDAGMAGRAYNAVAGTGLIQPIDALLRTMDRPTDDRHSYGERALESLAGAHVLDVDPQQADIQNLQQDLMNDVNAHPSSDFWTKDPETAQTLKEYRHLKAQHAKQAR